MMRAGGQCGRATGAAADAAAAGAGSAAVGSAAAADAAGGCCGRLWRAADAANVAGVTASAAAEAPRSLSSGLSPSERRSRLKKRSAAGQDHAPRVAQKGGAGDGHLGEVDAVDLGACFLVNH